MNTFSPYVRVAMDSTLPAGCVIQERTLWDYEILYVKEGEMEARIEGRSYACQPGDVLILKPRVRHSFHVDGRTPLRQPHAHFDLVEQENSPEVAVSFVPIEQMSDTQKRWFRPDELSGSPLSLPAHIRLGNPVPFEDLLFRLISEFEMRLPYGELRTKGLLLELLSLLLRETGFAGQTRDPRRARLLADVQRYLSLHADRPVTLEELSERFGISPHRLIGAFKQAYGTTPMLYHARQRHIRACNLLRFSVLTVQEIADRLGFSDIHAFSRAFKNKEGVAPTAYRAAP